jgi:hypothetical protein
MDNLMLEERVYTESLSEFISGRGLNKAISGNLTFRLDEESQGTKKFSTFSITKSQKIRIDSSSEYFGLFRVVITLLLIVLILVLIQITHYFILMPK